MAPRAPLRSTVSAAVCLGSLALCGGVALPAENFRAEHRSDPALFHIEWPQPPPLRGACDPPRPDGAALDITLHSAPCEAGGWVDFLYPSAWEKAFEAAPLTRLVRNWWWASYVAACLYLLILRMSVRTMKSRKPFGLKGSLALWNLFLSVFSFIGAARTVPHLSLLLREFGVEYTLCRAPTRGYGNGASGLWVALFIFSKYFELIDTAFLVLRKKPVAFLHWYHHTTVLLYCWNSYMWEMPSGIYFAAMNYSVHAIMYFYYFLAAVCSRPPKWALMVTVLQLTQMAVGIVVTVYHLSLLLNGAPPHCDGHVPNLTAALGMYASYFYLFAAFLLGRFCDKRDPGKKSE